VNQHFLKNYVDQRIKGTLGITGLFSSKVHIYKKVCHLDVDFARS